MADAARTFPFSINRRDGYAVATDGARVSVTLPSSDMLATVNMSTADARTFVEAVTAALKVADGQ